MKTLHDLLEAHALHLRALGMSEHTILATLGSVRALLRRLSVRHQVHTADRLRRPMLDDWRQQLSTRLTSRGHPLKPSSINRQIECVRGFLKYLVRQGYVQAALTEALPYVKEPRLLPASVLTHAQVKQLLALIDTGTPEGHRDRALFELLYSTGIRVGELIGLDIGDVDRHNRTLLVTGKGRKQRVVPIGKTALRFLESFTVAVRPYLLRRADEKALFLDHRGRRLKYHVIARRLTGYAELARLPVHVTPHTFRRSCTTELIRGGANLYHVKELLGHESLDTVRHYARLTIVDLKATHAKCHPREREKQEGF